jgi:hypothetical protein
MIIQLAPDAQLNLAGPPYDTEGLTMTILGNKGAGKSNTLAVIAEEMHANQVPFIFYDPNGDAVSLRELGPDVIIIGQADHPETIRRADYDRQIAQRDPGQFIELALREGYSLVVDLNDYETDTAEYNPLCAFTALMRAHYRLSAKMRFPCGVLIDEAHCFAPQTGATALEQQSRRVLIQAMADGRKRGMLTVTATQHAVSLSKNVIRGANVRVFGKHTFFPDYDAIKYYLPPGWNHPKHGFPKMSKLASGQAILVSPNNWGLIQIQRRATTDLGKTPAFQNSRRRGDRPSKYKQLQLSIKVDRL